MGDLVCAPSPLSGAGKLRGCSQWAGLRRTPYHPLTRPGVSAVLFHSTVSRFGMNASRQEAFLCPWFSESLTLAPLSAS